MLFNAANSDIASVN